MDATATDALINTGAYKITVLYNPNGSTALFDVIYPVDGTVFYETPALITATLANPADLYININGKEYLVRSHNALGSI